MARSLFSTLVQINRAMERDAARREKALAREHAAAIRQAEKARKAEIRAYKAAASAATADQKRFQREAKEAHIAFMEAHAEECNSKLTNIYDDLDSLLAATLDIDDYFDLETLRRTTKKPPFDRGDLEEPTPTPSEVPQPNKPVFTQPPSPKGFFGKKKKKAIALTSAKAKHSEALRAWEIEIESIEKRRKKDTAKYEKDEQVRLALLEKERRRFVKEIIEHNREVDTFITNLNYGDPEAVQEYVSIVVSNSVYPEHFQIEYELEFVPETAELLMKVVVPSPSNFPKTKSYKYVKSSDQITETQLSLREQKIRYSSAIHQVGIRTFHEIYEADRRGIIRMISLEVGAKDTDPATGKLGFIPFLAAASERDAFIDFDLSGIVPTATLKHLGAAISKNPFDLIAVDTGGVRRS